MSLLMFCCHFQIVALPNLAPGQDVELVARVGPGGQDLVARVGNLDPAEVARTLQANPEIAQVRTSHNIRDDQIYESLTRPLPNRSWPDRSKRTPALQR